MNKLSTIGVISVISVATAVSVAAPAYAWHPKGKITKSVQNVTAGGAMHESLVSAKPGDVLKYSITVSNVAAPASKQYNDMAFTVMTDTLPAGVELVSSPATRTIREDIGLIVPGKSVTKTYDVRVTSTTDGAVIENKACFTGDSVVKDNPQKGCDTASAKVSVPKTPVTPQQPQTPAAPVAPAAQPTELVAVGTGQNVVLSFLAAGFLGFLAHKLVLGKRRTV